MKGESFIANQRLLATCSLVAVGAFGKTDGTAFIASNVWPFRLRGLASHLV